MFERKRFLALRIGITNLLTIFIPGFITLVYSIPPLKESLRDLLVLIEWYPVIKILQVPIAILSVLLIPFLVSLYLYKNSEKQSNSNERVLSALLAHIDTIVGVKNKRFYDYTCSYDPSKRKDIFHEITQPYLQIQEIIKNIMSLFELLYNDTTIKCSLLKVNEDLSFDYFVYLDGQPTTNINLLNEPDSTASICIADKKTIVIEDTSQELERFKHTFGTSSNCKSIICYPVFRGPDPCYVISVTSRIESTFREKDVKKYTYILEQFAKRITLESYLNIIKERANAQ